MSEGNGHPYSWSAILNGYDPRLIHECGFPSIPKYLECQSWPSAKINNAKVDYVWTQSLSISAHIAGSTFIPNVSDQYDDFIHEVDGVLLARDDYANHLKYSVDFLQAGLPIYIDKPIAIKLIDLDLIYTHQKFNGQIFTCSALRFAREFMIDLGELQNEIGEIRGIRGLSMKSWDKYAIHIIDPILSILERLQIYDDLKMYEKKEYLDTGVCLIAKCGSIDLEFITTGMATGLIEITFIGLKSEKKIVFTDPFTAFKSALIKFIEPINSGKYIDSYDYNFKLVKIIEAGL
jgi:hypothetical protein